jgi:hypothetical protein
VPVKLLFPKALFDPTRISGSGLSMLGLGDIVLPGTISGLNNNDKKSEKRIQTLCRQIKTLEFQVFRT